MNCNNYELFNCITSVCTALGTVGAVVFSIIVTLHRKRNRIEAVFIWGAPTRDQPTLLIQNIGKKVVVLDRIKFFFNRRKIGEICFADNMDFSDYAIIPADVSIKIPIPTKYICQPDKIGKKKKILKIIIQPRYGKKQITKQKYTGEELESLLFGSTLFSNEF